VLARCLRTPRRQRNISQASDATLMKRVQRPLSEVITVYVLLPPPRIVGKITGSENVTCN